MTNKDEDILAEDVVEMGGNQGETGFQFRVEDAVDPAGILASIKSDLVAQLV